MNVANGANATEVAEARNSAVYGDAWNLAFNILNPASRFDGSDTVEILWILGLDSGDISGWTDFFDFFPADGSTGGGTTTTTGGTTTTTTTSSSGEVVAIGNSLAEARANFSAVTSQSTTDCDPVGDGRWICATFNNPTLSDVNTGDDSSASSTTTDVDSTTTTEVASNGAAVLKIQAEAGGDFSGSGWETQTGLSGAEGSYIVWTGDPNFQLTGDEQPAGIKSYDFVITEAGNYEFTAQVQSRINNGSAASDRNNDAWVIFTTGSDVALGGGVNSQADKWTKFFQAGAPQSWSNYSQGEQFNPAVRGDIVRFLPVGTHRVLVGGRSPNFGIDFVGLSRR